MKTLLVVMAHPDDAELWAGGTIINYLENGWKVTIAYTYCDDIIRRSEAEQVVNELNVKILFKNDYPNDEEFINDLIIDYPKVILTHHPVDPHPEHSETFKIVQKIAPPLWITNRNKYKLFATSYYNLISSAGNVNFTPTHYIDISESWTKKLHLLRKYESQPIEYFINMIEVDNKLHGNRSGCQYAEAFIQLPVLGVVFNENKKVL